MNPKFTLSLACHLLMPFLGLQPSSSSRVKKNQPQSAIKEEHKSSKKASSSRNNNAVRIYPDIIQKGHARGS